MPLTQAEFSGKNSSLITSEQSCLMPISIGQPYHRSPKQEAAIQLAVNQFKSVTIVIADSLQRKTLQFKHNISAEDAYKRAIAEGNEWKKKYSSLTKDLNIIHWDYWISDPACKDKFDEARRFVETLYADNTDSFHKAVNSTIGSFLSHNISIKEKGGFHFDSPEAALSREYVLEECAVLLLWKDHHFNIVAYPSTINAALYDLLNRFIWPKTPNLLKDVNFSFKSVSKKNENSSAPYSATNRFDFFSTTNNHVNKKNSGILASTNVAFSHELTNIGLTPEQQILTSTTMEKAYSEISSYLSQLGTHFQTLVKDSEKIKAIEEIFLKKLFDQVEFSKDLRLQQ